MQAELLKMLPRGMGPNEFLVIAAVGLFMLCVLIPLAAALRAARYDILPSLVLTEYRVSSAALQGQFVVIAGRPEGVWHMLLSLIGLGTEIRFEVSKSAVQREMVQGAWHIIDSVPLQNVASTNFGSTKRLFYLVFGVMLSLGGFGSLLVIFLTVPPANAAPAIGGAIGGILLGLLSVLAYFMSKRVLIQVETAGGRFIGVQFRPSLVNHLTVDLDAAAKAVQIINSLIVSGAVP